MKRIILAMVSVVTFGCSSGSSFEYLDVDLCRKRTFFQECMAAIPAGPERTHYNDWSEIVDICNERSHWDSLRPARDIPRECR